MRRGVLVLVAAGLLGGPAARAYGAPPPYRAVGADPFADSGARLLYDAAVAYRSHQQDAVVRYTAVVRQRVGAAIRMPLKDRTVYRAESAERVFWSRDHGTVVQVLALREQTPMGVSHGDVHATLVDRAFDPMNDQLLFGLVEPDDKEYQRRDDDFWFEHPLLPTYRDEYRFSTGDTLTLSLPDGSTVRAVELRVVPVVADVHRMTGSLWIEPESGALVRAVYRLSETLDVFRDIPDVKEEEDEDLKHVPGLLKPWTMDLSLISVDYSLWDGDVWLPRSLHAQGTVRAGIIKAPAELDLGYQIEDVVTQDDLERMAPEQAREAETPQAAVEAIVSGIGGDTTTYVMAPGWSSHWSPRGRRTVRYVVPEDPHVLLTSPQLPPPIWDDAPGFASQDEIHRAFQELSALPAPATSTPTPYTFRWGLQRPDLVRYNRIEGLSLGARGQIRPTTPLGPLSVTATVRLGSGDLHPDARLDVTQETLTRRVTWSVFHELTAVDQDARHLKIGNSLTALLFGRDDGDYYRRTGTWLEWTPPSAERTSFRVRAYGEYQQPVRPWTDFSLWHLARSSAAFRDNLVAEEGWEVGGLVTLSPWWGTDPRSAQGGVELTLQGAGGDFHYARSSLTARVALPIPGDFRVALEGAAGTSWGSPPPQRLWLVGGASTLRGYAPRTLMGSSFGRGRAEVARLFSFGAVSLFSDVAWAGDRNDIRWDGALYSAGAGISLVDGLIRMDGAWGLRQPRGFRLELYLDGIL